MEQHGGRNYFSHNYYFNCAAKNYHTKICIVKFQLSYHKRDRQQINNNDDKKDAAGGGNEFYCWSNKK